jgi:hypothetical protein
VALLDDDIFEQGQLAVAGHIPFAIGLPCYNLKLGPGSTRLSH